MIKYRGLKALHFGPSPAGDNVVQFDPTSECLVLGLDETNRSIVICDRGDADSITSTIVDGALSEPGIVLIGKTPTAGKYAYLRPTGVGSAYPRGLAVKGRGASKVYLIVQQDEDSNDSDHIQLIAEDTVGSQVRLIGTAYGGIAVLGKPLQVMNNVTTTLSGDADFALTNPQSGILLVSENVDTAVMLFISKADDKLYARRKTVGGAYVDVAIADFSP